MTEIYFRQAEDYLETLAEAGARNLLFYKFDTPKNIGEKVIKAYGSLEGLSVIMVGENKKWFIKDGEKYPIFKFKSPLREFKKLAKEYPLIFVTQCPPYFPYHRSEIREKLEKLNKRKGEAKIHLVGSNSIRLMHENEIDVMDVNPYKLAKVGSIILPNGTQVKKERFDKVKKWIAYVGFSLTSLKSVKDYTLFNIKSFLLAGREENIAYEEPDFPKLRESKGGKGASKEILAKARLKRAEIRQMKKEQVYCNDCLNTCEMYSEGGVCVKNEQFKSLAMMFRTRDPELLKDGLIHVLASSAERYQAGTRVEKVGHMLIKEVTEIEKSLLKNGIEMLKLLSPELKPVSNKIILENPNVLAAIMVKAGEKGGVERKDIDAEKVLRVITQGSDKLAQKVS